MADLPAPAGSSDLDDAVGVDALHRDLPTRLTPVLETQLVPAVTQLTPVLESPGEAQQPDGSAAETPVEVAWSPVPGMDDATTIIPRTYKVHPPHRTLFPPWVTNAVYGVLFVVVAAAATVLAFLITIIVLGDH